MPAPDTVVEFQILGPLTIVQSDGERLDTPPPKQLAILALLLIHHDVVLSADRIIDEVWGDEAPKSGLKTLQYHVSKLRDFLEPDRSRGSDGNVVMTQGAGYVVSASDQNLDAARFEKLLEEALTLDPAGRRTALDGALALWRGRALEDVANMPSARVEGDRLEELRLTALESRIEADLVLGDHTSIIAELEVLTGQHPLRERLWGQLMLALYRSDRQAEALRSYQAARAILGDQLGVEPSVPLRELEARILAQDEALTPLPAAATPSKTNIPLPVSSFVGRADALTAIERLLKEHRLVTLLGPGGVGKTRLATQIAPQLSENFGDGVFLVELGGLSDPGHVLKAVRMALGVPQQAARSTIDAVCGHLKTRSVLIVLDNCEHLIEAASELASLLLGGASGLRIVATSREPLRAPGETTWPVPPLEFPDSEESADFERPTEAMVLFAERARAVDNEFALSERNAGAVAEVCRRLDGLPLAIQLAAARARALSVHEIAERLDNRLSLASDGERGVLAHHQTLEAVVGWSYELLGDDEKELFVSLGIFANSFTLDGVEYIAEALAFGRDETARLLTSLVDKSLIVVSRDDGESRYRMLETVREFAKLRLAQRMDLDAITRTHTEWTLAFAEEANAELMGPSRAAWSRRIMHAFDDMRAVLERSYDQGNPENGVRLISAMEPFFIEVGDHEGFLTTTAAIDGASWLERLMTVRDVAPEVLAPVLSVRGFLLMLQGDDVGASSVLKRSLELFELIHDPIGKARAQMYLATTLWSNETHGPTPRPPQP